MKNEIKRLRKAQKLMWDMQYPGYPFQLVVVIDLEDKVAYVNWNGRRQPLEKALRDIDAGLIYRCLGAKNTSKQTWIINQHLEPYSQYLDYEYDDFYFDNLNAVKFYFALNSAIYGHKKTDKGFIFACIDDDTDYVDVRVFYKEEDVDQFVKDYFEGE